MAAASPSRLTGPRLDAGAEPQHVRLSAAGRVLILSGDEQSAEAVGRILEPRNFVICRVGTVGNALEMLSSDPPADLALLDVEPGSEAVLSSVRRIAGHVNGSSSPIPILLLTDAEHISEAIEAIRLGAYDYLVKPFQDEQLLASVARVVEHRRLRVQNDAFRHHLEQLITARTAMIEQTMGQLEQSYDVTLEALGNALDLKDAETEGHSKRVTAYTLALGRAMGLNEQQLRIVGRGAFLHDIGKMAIPDAILRKPGKLTAEERAIMSTHSELGYRMVRKIPFLREAAEIVYAHQESYDGSGYPRGLRGEQIHIGARIFALADTFDAITSNRPYRKANTIAEARKEVLRCAGSQFDPAIVDVFVATPDSIWQNLREGIMRAGPEFSPFGYTFGEPTPSRPAGDEKTV